MTDRLTPHQRRLASARFTGLSARQIAVQFKMKEISAQQRLTEIRKIVGAERNASLYDFRLAYLTYLEKIKKEEKENQ